MKNKLMVLGKVTVCIVGLSTLALFGLLVLNTWIDFMYYTTI